MEKKSWQKGMQFRKIIKLNFAKNSTAPNIIATMDNVALLYTKLGT